MAQKSDLSRLEPPNDLMLSEASILALYRQKLAYHLEAYWKLAPDLAMKTASRLIFQRVRFKDRRLPAKRS